MIDPTQGLLEALAKYDLYPSDIVWDDQFHRFPGAGKGPRNRAGWYRAFADRRGAIFGDHSAGLNASGRPTGKKSQRDTLNAGALEERSRREYTMVEPGHLARRRRDTGGLEGRSR